MYINNNLYPCAIQTEKINNVDLNFVELRSQNNKVLVCLILLDDIEILAKKGEINVKPTCKQEIVSEASKSRGNFSSKIVEKRHIEAAK